MNAAASLSERIDRLEHELLALYSLRAGQQEPGQDYGWCVQCGRNPVYPADGWDTCRSCAPTSGSARLASP